MPKIISVSKCVECPFFKKFRDMQASLPSCNHPNAKKWSINMNVYEVGVPDLCPLHGINTVIKLKKKDSLPN